MTLDDCAEEPIHIPGAVQPHAALVVLRNDAIVQASDNVGDVLGIGDEILAHQGQLPGPLLDALRSVDPPGRGRATTDRISTGAGLLDVTVSSIEDLRLVQIELVEEPAVSFGEFQDGVFGAVQSIQGATSVDEVVEGVTQFVRELTGFDRVMAYQFWPDDHGVVIAEQRRGDLEPFLGLHYPASDIPAQARRLYLENWLRVIPDVDYVPVPIRPTLTPGTGQPLDLSSVDSRAVSPIHCQYLRNMGVAASMSISLVVDGRLWGLVACHHYSGPRNPSAPIRQACEFVSLAASLVLGANRSAEREADRAERETILNHLARDLLSETDLLQGLVADPSLLKRLLDADGAAVVLNDAVRTTGDTPEPAVIRRLAEYCARRSGAELFATAELGSDVELDLELGGTAGMAALPISSAQRNYVFWFRDEWAHEVRWAGQPEKAVVRASDGDRLSPRASFDEWIESVAGRSRPWADADLATAEELRSLIGRHISRTAEQLARLNSELARSNSELDAFAYVAAHDLKEPLRGMANYATFLAEDYADVLDEEGREQVEQMLELANRMGGLLRSLLDYARVGRAELRRERIGLAVLVDDVSTLLSARLAETGGAIEVVDDVELSVDVDAFTQVLMNLISNGLKYNDGVPHIRVGTRPVRSTRDGRDRVRRSATAEGEQLAVYVQDNGIGIAPEHLDEVFRVFRRLHDDGSYGGGEGAGLTIGRRIVERHGGAIWAENNQNGGTTFYLTIGDS